MTRMEEGGKRDEVPVETRPEDAAHYIQVMSAELSIMARRSGFDFLGYLLDVVREEAAARAMEASGKTRSKLS